MHRLLLLSRATSKALSEIFKYIGVIKARERHTCVSNVTFKWDNACTFKKRQRILAINSAYLRGNCAAAAKLQSH